MKTLNIGGNDYKLEYSFEAAEFRDIVQKMFDVMSGAFMFKRIKPADESEKGDMSSEKKEPDLRIGMLDASTALVAEIPHICKTAFYAGLLENENVSEKEAVGLMRTYMKDNKISYSALYDSIKECMEEDGFFDLSGITENLKKMNEAAEQAENLPKQPKDHLKKSTSTK